MKKLYLTAIICAGTAVGALAQGTIIFDSSASTGSVTFGVPKPNASAPTNTPAAGTWTAALLFAPGTTLGQPLGSFTQIATVSGSDANNGYISGSTIETIPSGDGESAGAAGTFIVEAWTGSYANYAAALVGTAGTYVGASVEFANNVGNPNPPPTAAQPMTGWDGNLELFPIPEPGTLALGGLGAAALLLFRRRK